MEYLITLAVLAGLVLAAFTIRARFSRVTVFEFEKALKYRKGKLVGTLGPGQYWIYRPWTIVHKVDVRPSFVSITGQEVLSADGVTLKASLAANYEIVDPDTAINKVQNYQQALYLTLQLALREIVGGSNIDDVLEKRDEFGDRLLQLTTKQVDEIGLKLISVDLKDIMFPGDLKKIFAQVVQARKEGLAALEKARGETAALRNLANAARLMEGNPSLMQLRLLQQLASSSGNTLVLGFPTTNTPLPMRARDVEPATEPEIGPPEE